MNRHFQKGGYRKELVYGWVVSDLCKNHHHVISQYPSDRKGHIKLEHERREEMPSRARALGVFWEWALELSNEGWACEESTAGEILCHYHEARAKAEEAQKREYRRKPRPVVQENYGWVGSKVTRKCKLCGAEFTAMAKGQKYCCKEHAKEAHDASLKKAMNKYYQTVAEKRAIMRKVEMIAMKTNDVMSWYESASYVISEFMKKAETSEEVQFIADAVGGCLDSALKDATVRLAIAKKYPAKAGGTDAPDVKKAAEPVEKGGKANG